jgi:hypothetical protein
MPRTPAKVHQADIARCARVAQTLGPDWGVEVMPDGTIRLCRLTAPKNGDENCRNGVEPEKRPVL